LVFWERVLLCSPDWPCPWGLPELASQVWGLHACTAMQVLFPSLLPHAGDCTQALSMLGKCSTTELYPQTPLSILDCLFSQMKLIINFSNSRKKSLKIYKFNLGKINMFMVSASSRYWIYQESVAHACNPSYSGGRDLEDQGSKPAQANSLRDPISKNHSQK
jgi:hypothetical protein